MTERELWLDRWRNRVMYAWNAYLIESALDGRDKRELDALAGIATVLNETCPPPSVGNGATAGVTVVLGNDFVATSHRERRERVRRALGEAGEKRRMPLGLVVAGSMGVGAWLVVAAMLLVRSCGR